MLKAVQQSEASI